MYLRLNLSVLFLSVIEDVTLFVLTHFSFFTHLQLFKGPVDV